MKLSKKCKEYKWQIWRKPHEWRLKLRHFPVNYYPKPETEFKLSSETLICTRCGMTIPEGILQR